ncbi:MAG: phosphatase PAP2 family protein [Pseudomonadota bacterium]|nr:phosphatase PAP2 family protein [Pseudomonadota bacterium]
MTRHGMLTTFLVVVLIEALLIAYADRPLSDTLRGLENTHPDIINVFRAYTDLGKSKWYLWPCGLGASLIAFVMHKARLGAKARVRLAHIGAWIFLLFVYVSVSGLVTDMIKPLLGRARPVELKEHGIYAFAPLTFDARWNSLPSGHATTAFTLAFALAGFFPRARYPLFAGGALLALSRVIINAHYLSDVVAGAAIAFLTIWCLRRGRLAGHLFKIIRRIFPLEPLSPEIKATASENTQS